jgi:hypothetical protein
MNWSSDVKFKARNAGNRAGRKAWRSSSSATAQRRHAMTVGCLCDRRHRLICVVCACTQAGRRMVRREKKSHATWSHRPPVRPHADAVCLSIQRSEKLVVARPASAPKVYDGSAPALFVFILSHGSGPACFVSPYPLDLRVVGRRARRAALLRIPLLCYLPPPRCNRRLRLPRFPRLESLLVKGKVYAAMYELSSDDETCVLTVGITPAIFFSGLLKLLAMMCGMWP